MDCDGQSRFDEVLEQGYLMEQAVDFGPDQP